MRDNITGKWAGQYTMGEGYPSRLKGVSVPFTIELEDKNGVISGTCLDAGYADFDSPASINGSMDGQFLTFVKKYPYRWSSRPDGTVVYYKDQPSHEVHYSGELRNTLFSGEWKIFTKYVTIFGKHAERVIAGSWIMHRVDLEGI